jgi:tetratricopeptide (TPR) repeat protein
MRHAIHILIVAVLLLLTQTASVKSARAEDAITRTAKRHFTKGENLFALGKFDEALEEYQSAFEAKSIPGFLFNIGQCYRNLGDLDQAIFSFRKYLTLQPDAPNASSVESLIKELEDTKARENGARLIGDKRNKRMDPEKPPPEKARPIYKKWWFWTGVGVVAVAGGTTAYLLSRGSDAPSTSLGDIPLNR